MTRVAGPQCSPYFQADTPPDPLPAPAPTPDPATPKAGGHDPATPKAGGQQARGRRSKGKAQRLYELIKGKGRAARRASKERASAERQGDIITAATHAAAGMIEEVPGALGQAVGAAGLLAVPLTAIWATLDGLATIGKAHADAQRGAEQRELRRGLAEAVGLAVDRPELSPEQIRTQLKRDGHYIDNINRATNSHLKIKAHSRKKWRKLGQRFLEGGEEGLRLVRSLSPDDTRKLAALLKLRVAGETSAERVSNLIKYGAKTHD
jgi:hypothetical protein